MSLLSLFMNKEDKNNSEHWTEEERDRIASFFQLLLKIDKRQNPGLYKTVGNRQNRTVLDNDGNEVTL